MQTLAQLKEKGEKCMVVGKELVITKKVLRSFLDEEYGKNVANIQDVWYDKETQQIHVKVASIVPRGKNPHEKIGFQEIKGVGDVYPVIEKLDDRLIQLTQSSYVLNKDW